MAIFNLTHENKRDGIVMLKIMTPLLLVLFAAFHFREFVIHAIKAGFIINMGIIVVAFYGMVLILMRLHSAQRDFRVIERFGREANRGAEMKDLLNEPWLKSVYVRHYLAHIANTGGTLHSQIDQNAIENELHALQAEYNSRLELPQFISGFMIALGLLGTFVGLLETLTGISGMLDGMGAPGQDVQKQFGELVVKLRNPLAGMGIAFSASMFGLIASLLLAIMMINLRRYISRVISLARNVMHDLTVIASHHVHPTPSANKTRSESALANSVSNTTIAGRFDLLTRKIEAVLEAFESSTAVTQRMVDLMGFGPRMRELSEKTVEEMKALSIKFGDQQQLMKSFIEIGNETLKVNKNMLDTYINMEREGRTEISSATGRLVETMQRVEEVNVGGARHLYDIKERLAKLNNTMNMMDLIASGVSGQTVLLETLVEETRLAKGGHSSSLPENSSFDMSEYDPE